MTNQSRAYYQSPIGTLEITGSEEGISSIEFSSDGVEAGRVPACLDDCHKQLGEFFKGQREEFSIQLDLQGTPFQTEVWSAVTRVPFGTTVSYLDIAKTIQRDNATRAVGNANGKNPVPIVIPCHRIIGSNRQLTGYGGGLWRKQWLIDFEKGILEGH